MAGSMPVISVEKVAYYSIPFRKLIGYWQQAGLPVHISHFKSSGQNNWGLVRGGEGNQACYGKKGKSSPQINIHIEHRALR